MISAYCLSYGNWTVIPSHWDYTFADMVTCGFDAVALSFSESEDRYARRCFEQQVKAAHGHGLKVLAIPSRLGGRFAGAPFMPSGWLLENPESQVPGHAGLACLEDPAFLRRTEDFIRTLVDDFGVDGLIWDEPKGVDIISTHPATLERFGPNPSRNDMFQSMLDYIDHLTAFARKLRPDLSITLFNMPVVAPEFTRRSAQIKGLDYVGFDGRCCRESYFHEEPVWDKPTVRSLWPQTVEEVAAHSGTFALIENMLIPDACIEEFEAEYIKALDEMRPDHLSIYYYGHNNESPERIQRLCMKHLKERLLT
jgi:hypothetical protein